MIARDVLDGETKEIYKNLFLIETTTSYDARETGNALLKEDKAWELIEDERYWKQWKDEMKNVVKDGPNKYRDESGFRKWKKDKEDQNQTSLEEARSIRQHIRAWNACFTSEGPCGLSSRKNSLTNCFTSAHDALHAAASSPNKQA